MTSLPQSDKRTNEIFESIAEAALRESKERLRILIENLPGGAAFVVDCELRYLLAEGEALGTAGFKPEDFVGKTIFEALAPNLAAQYEALYRQGLAGNPFMHEHDAHGRSFISRGTPLRSQDGEVYAVLVVSYDITDRKSMEAALRESEERFRATFEQANVGIVQATPDGRILVPNPGFCKIVGYTEAECKTLTVRDITHPDDYDADMGQARRVIAGEITGYTIEKRYIRQTGETVWVHMASTLVRHPSGEPYYALAIVEDITERKLAEAALRESEERLRLATEAARMYSWGFDLKTQTPRFSANTGAVTGRAPSSSFEENLQSIHPDDRATVIGAFERAIAGDGGFGYEMRAFGGDNQIDWYHVAGVVLRDATGKPARAVGISQNITERKRAEMALQRANERFNIAEEAVNGFIYDWDIITGKVTRSNGFTRVLGYAQDEVEETSAAWIALIHPDDRPTVLLQPSDTRDHFSEEYRVQHKHGHYIHVLDRSLVIRDQAGNIRRMVGSTVDITASKQAEAALRESEARFRTLADAVPQVIWANDADGRAIYFNQRWYDYSGLSYDESVGLGWQAIVHPGDAPASVERWQRALAAGEVFDTEYRLRRADGVYCWHLGRNVPLRDQNGQIAGWFGSATDIEDLKQAEAARRESDERFRLLVEGARDYAMFLLDIDNRITFWSVGAERVFGWSQTEVVGKSGAIIFTPEDRERGEIEREIQTALTEGRAEDRRWHIRKDRARLFLDGVLIRLDDERGLMRGFVKIARDATAQRVAEEALQRARDELEQRVQERTAALAEANRALQQEIAERRQIAAQRTMLLERIITAQEGERQRIAHELHDSLGQFLSALNLRLSMAQSVEGILPAVSAELARLQALANQIDREVDRLTMELRPPALDHLGLPDALRRYAEEWTATSGVPVDVLVRGLDDRLAPAIETTAYRIVQEALTNVLKHAQASAVSMIVERRGGALRVIVEDDGVGFDQSSRAATAAGGRQVGLIGMAERAGLAGGDLIIESAPGVGTTVYLHIPLGEDRPG